MSFYTSDQRHNKISMFAAKFIIIQYITFAVFFPLMMVFLLLFEPGFSSAKKWLRQNNEKYQQKNLEHNEFQNVMKQTQNRRRRGSQCRASQNHTQTHESLIKAGAGTKSRRDCKSSENGIVVKNKKRGEKVVKYFRLFPFGDGCWVAFYAVSKILAEILMELLDHPPAKWKNEAQKTFSKREETKENNKKNPILRIHSSRVFSRWVGSRNVERNDSLESSSPDCLSCFMVCSPTWLLHTFSADSISRFCFVWFPLIK